MGFYNPVGSTGTVTSMFLATHGIFPNPGAKVLFVGNSTTATSDGAISGSNGNSGLSPKEPLSTLAGAVAMCKAGRGDVIVIMPGHAETNTAVVNINVAGVQVIGCGVGNLRPTFTINAAADCIRLSAAGVLVSGIHITAPGTDEATAMFDVTAANCMIKDCTGIGSGSSKNFVDCITIASGADDLVVDNVDIRNTNTAVNSFLSVEAAVARLTVKNSFFFGDCVTAGFIDAAAATQVFLFNNSIGTIGTTIPAIIWDSNPTGVVDNNRFYGTHTTIASNAQLGNAVRQSRSYVLEETDNSKQATNIIPALDVD